ncbi:MAG: tail fiber protein [Microcella pacifica]
MKGDTTPLPYSPVGVIDEVSLAVGDWVLVALVESRYAIVGREQSDPGGFIGEHRAGEWATPPHPAWVLANGAVLNIADYPKLAAHYASTYGTSNHHGGNGTTTFAVPDTRERTYVNQGGSDVFADIGAVTGAKTHDHELTPGTAYAQIMAGNNLNWNQVSTGGWTRNRNVTNIGTATGTSTITEGTGVEGATDGASTVQPSFVARFIIRAA